MAVGIGPARGSVDRSGSQPALVVTDDYALNLAFGATRVSAGQHWTFTSRLTAAGWQLTGAVPDGFVDWASPFPG